MDPFLQSSNSFKNRRRGESSIGNEELLSHLYTRTPKFPIEIFYLSLPHACMLLSRCSLLSLLLLIISFPQLNAQTIYSVDWQTAGPVRDGRVVKIKATHNPIARGIDILKFEIYENEPWPAADKYVETITIKGNVGSSTTYADWASEWQDDGFASGDPEFYAKVYFESHGINEVILPHLIFSELERIENSNLGKIPVAFDAFRLFHPGSDQSHL